MELVTRKLLMRSQIEKGIWDIPADQLSRVLQKIESADSHEELDNVKQWMLSEGF